MIAVSLSKEHFRFQGPCSKRVKRSREQFRLSMAPTLDSTSDALRAKNCRYGGFIDICFSFGLHGAHKLEETRLGDLGQFFAICPPLLHSCSPPLHIEKIIDKF